MISLLVAGPALLVFGWIILIGNAGRGANDLWMVGHYVLFAGNAIWIPIVLILRRYVPRRAEPRGNIVLAMVIIGSLTIAGQLAIDFTAWALGLDQEGLRAFFADIRSRPILPLTLHIVGPSLLFFGLLLEAFALATAGKALRPSGRLIGTGIALVFVGALSTFSYVILTGYVVVLIGFVILALRLRVHGDQPAVTGTPPVEGTTAHQDARHEG